MKIVKIVAILALVYVGIVVLFESLLGYYQPASETTLVITTSDDDGSYDRVLQRIDSDGKLYVAANHWPRAWYRRVLDYPDVTITFAGESAGNAYVAVAVDDAEHERVANEHPLGLVFRALTGFPPRYFVRLDPA